MHPGWEANLHKIEHILKTEFDDGDNLGCCQAHHPGEELPSPLANSLGDIIPRYPHQYSCAPVPVQLVLAEKQVWDLIDPGSAPDPSTIHRPPLGVDIPFEMAFENPTLVSRRYPVRPFCPCRPSIQNDDPFSDEAYVHENGSAPHSGIADRWLAAQFHLFCRLDTPIGAIPANVSFR